MAKRSGNVTSVLRNMRFSQIGRLTPRFVAPESTNAIVGLCFQGFFWAYPCSSHLYPSVFFCNFFFFEIWGLWIFFSGFFWFFWRRDSFITHRAFCDALAEESARNQPQPQTQTQTQASEKPNSESDPKITGGNSSPKVPAPAPPPPPTAPPPAPQSSSVIPSALQTKNPGRYQPILDNMLSFLVRFRLMWFS